METLTNITTLFFGFYPALFLVLAVVSVAVDALKVRANEIGRFRFVISALGWFLAVLFVAYAKWSLVAANLDVVK